MSDFLKLEVSICQSEIKMYRKFVSMNRYSLAFLMVIFIFICSSLYVDRHNIIQLICLGSVLTNILFTWTSGLIDKQDLKIAKEYLKRLEESRTRYNDDE